MGINQKFKTGVPAPEAIGYGARFGGFDSWLAIGDEPLYFEVEEARALRDWLTAILPEQCEHRWVDATNEVVSGTDLCTKCGLLRAQLNQDGVAK